MKKIFFILMLLLKYSFNNATHIEGADLTYRTLTNDTLEFTFNFIVTVLEYFHQIAIIFILDQPIVIFMIRVL